MDHGSNTISLCRELTVRLNERQLLNSQSLACERGTVTVLMGPSGVGKSVLAAVLFGVAHGAAISWEGEVGDAARRGALVFQHASGLAHLTVNDNLRLAGASVDEVNRLTSEFGLEKEQGAWSLSGGESRRLATASAIAANRELLWLDEPAAGLDIARMDRLAAELRSQASEHGIAVVVTTHRVEFAEAVADRVLFLGFDGVLRELKAPGRPPSYGLQPSRDAQGSSPVRTAKLPDGSLRAGLSDALAKTASAPHGRTRRERRVLSFPSWFDWTLELARSLPGLRGAFIGYARVWWKTLGKSIVLGALQGVTFYPFVGAIFGAMFLLIFEMTLAFLDTSQVIMEFGPTVVQRLAPPFAAILAAARSGSAIGAWIGQMSAGRQFDSLRVLGVSPVRAITSAAWLGMIVSTVIATGTFALALSGVFAGYLWFDGEPFAELLHATFLSDLAALARVGLYSVLVASVTLAMARRPASQPGDVARGITTAIVLSTIWVMLSELGVLFFERIDLF